MAGTIQQLAQEIRTHVGWNPDDPQDLHDSMQGMGQVGTAMEDAFRSWAQHLAETNVDPSMPEAREEAANAIHTVMDGLDAKFGGGVMRRSG